MIVRPAEETPFSALALAVLAERAGIPPGVFSVVTGEPIAIAKALTESAEVRALSFTGSTPVGRALLRQCADSVKRVSLELGGHAPFIVFKDADINRVVPQAVHAKFQTSGQDCLAANRFLIHRSVYAGFVEAFAQMASRLRVGNGLEPDVDIGPLISESAVERCESQVADALQHGARLTAGGARHAAGTRFMAPTVLADVHSKMRIWREETFGPVAAFTPFDTEAEAIALANDSEYGLAAYVFTNDGARAVRLGDALDYGMVALNTARFTGAPIPFGGMKQSGLGREGSRHGLDAFTELKYLCLSYDAA
jgi:acyl-CoA reductase-like NAD-dependent aldehyde dehydrogenase